VLQSSGKTIKVEAGQTIVEACTLADVDVMVSCEQGVCGTCITSVIEGIPDHRDVYLTPQEKADGHVMLPCCSRSKTPRIVLDL
jgi:vanillate O-demethylase ferredoxin subunit